MWLSEQWLDNSNVSLTTLSLHIVSQNINWYRKLYYYILEQYLVSVSPHLFQCVFLRTIEFWESEYVTERQKYIAVAELDIAIRRPYMVIFIKITKLKLHPHILNMHKVICFPLRYYGTKIIHFIWKKNECAELKTRLWRLVPRLNLFFMSFGLFNLSRDLFILYVCRLCRTIIHGVRLWLHVWCLLFMRTAYAVCILCMGV